MSPQAVSTRVPLEAEAGDGEDASARQRGLGPTVAPREQWAVDLGAVIYARPTLVAGPDGKTIAYVGNHAGRFVGVVVDGPTAGQTVLELWFDGIIWSTAVADEAGRLYFGADDDRLRAVDRATGTLAWELRLGDCDPPRAPGPIGVRCDVDGGPTLGPDGDLYVGADGLYRVTRAGEIVWHYPSHDADSDADAQPGAHVVTTPLVTDDAVVFGNYARQLVALDHQGTLRWALELGADVDGSPVLGADGSILVGSDDGRLRAVSQAGEVRWRYDVRREIRTRPAIGSDGTIVFGAYDGNLHALHSDGRPRWRLPTAAPIHAPATIDPAGRIFVGGRDERLYALDLEGHVYWNLELPGQIDSGVAISPEGTLVVGCDDGVLRALR